MFNVAASIAKRSAVAVLNAQNGHDAIVSRISNDFGDVIVFTDKEARDSYDSVVSSFTLKGEETVAVANPKFANEGEGLTVAVEVAWGQLPY